MTPVEQMEQMEQQQAPKTATVPHVSENEDEDEYEYDDDDDDEFEGTLKQEEDMKKEFKEEKEQQQSPPGRVPLLFVLLFSLFEPFPQLALLTLTRSGASCALAVAASLVQPEVAALYFAAVRGHAQHHPLLFGALVLAALADTLFGNLYNALAVALRLALPRARWDALARYCAEVQGDIDRSRAKRD